MESGTVGTIVTWFCLVSAVATIVVSSVLNREKFKWPFVPLGVGLAISAVLFLVKGWVGSELSSAFVSLAVGIPVGVLFAGLSQHGFSALTKVVVGAGVVGFLVGGGLNFAPNSGASEALALAAGLGIGASLLALIKLGPRSYDLLVIGVLAVLVESLASHRLSDQYEQSGVFLLAGAVAASLLGLAVTKAAKGNSPYGVAAGVVLFGLSVWYWGAVFYGAVDIFYSGLAGVAAALICSWAVAKEGVHKPFSFALGSLLWLGVATYAFSLERGLGMSIAALVGVLTMLLLDRRDVLVTVSPIVALVFYRLFTEMFPNSTRALDIGQHYGLLGLLVGIAVVIVVMEALESMKDTEGLKARGAGVLTSLIALGLVLAATAFLGQKGSVGLLVGLCLGPAVKSLGARVSVGSVALSLALVAAFVIAHPLVTAEIELDHHGKQNLVLWTGGIALVLGLVAGWLAKPVAEKENAA